MLACAGVRQGGRWAACVPDSYTGERVTWSQAGQSSRSNEGARARLWEACSARQCTSARLQHCTVELRPAGAANGDSACRFISSAQRCVSCCADHTMRRHADAIHARKVATSGCMIRTGFTPLWSEQKQSEKVRFGTRMGRTHGTNGKDSSGRQPIGIQEILKQHLQCPDDKQRQELRCIVCKDCCHVIRR